MQPMREGLDQPPGRQVVRHQQGTAEGHAVAGDGRLQRHALLAETGPCLGVDTLDPRVCEPGRPIGCGQAGIGPVDL